MAPVVRMADHVHVVCRARIYICDDSPEYRMLLRMVLADVGATIVGEAADGGEALAGAAATDPSLVLLDLNMPGLDGLEALPRLREVLPADVKIVVLTTSRAAESEQAAMAAGADAYVTKPIDATSVPELLREKLAA
jgi:two-component system, chemotaxis family, chemotaxis protein CheY